MSMTSKLVEQFAKPATVGVLSYVGSMAMLPQNQMNVLGYSMNSNMFYGILGVGGSFASEIAHNWILPHIPGNKKFAQMESMLLAPAVNAGIFVLGTKYYMAPALYSPSVDLIKPAAVGAGSEIGGQYLYEAVIHPYLR